MGLGKLGLPCALVLDAAGHEMLGYDVSTWADSVLAGGTPPPAEEGIDSLIKNHELALAENIHQVVTESDVVFVAVQTPHSPEYGGDTHAPASRRDFDYTTLVQAVREICAEALEFKHAITLAIVSTVLPGTCSRVIRPLLNQYVTLVYTPAFIAMGTTIQDYVDPEFVLVGADQSMDANPIREIFAKVHDAPVVQISIDSAELAKVSYNTFISMKIAFANTVMEICQNTGADCDQVYEALSRAHRRLISPAYMRGGMGDGGACHPRDLIAMSWLSQRLDLSSDFIGSLVSVREDQSAWLAELAIEQSKLTDLSIGLLGKSYKARSPLTAGSPGLLLAEQLKALSPRFDADLLIWDPYTSTGRTSIRWQAPHWVGDRHVFVVSMNHPEFPALKFARGSVVIDPWGYMPDQPGVTVIRVGRKS